MKNSIILGSESPRRKEILDFFSLPFEQVSSGFSEESVPYTGNPQSYASSLSQGKADALAHRFPNTVVITADTVVYRKGKLYGKPVSMKEALQFLQELNGEWHSVYTAVTVMKNENMQTAVEETRVLFNRLDEHQMQCYLAGQDVLDKAGAYAIQQGGGIIVKKIEGCYYNVMGLPINTLGELLKQFNIDLWQHLKKSTPIV